MRFTFPPYICCSNQLSVSSEQSPVNLQLSEKHGAFHRAARGRHLGVHDQDPRKWKSVV